VSQWRIAWEAMFATAWIILGAWLLSQVVPLIVGGATNIMQMIGGG